MNEIMKTVIEDSSLLGCYCLLTGKWFQIFWRSIVPPPSGSGSPRRLIFSFHSWLVKLEW